MIRRFIRLTMKSTGTGVLFDVTLDLGSTSPFVLPEFDVHELDLAMVELSGALPAGAVIRLYLGEVLIASTSIEDGADLLLAAHGNPQQLSSQPRSLFRDWGGVSQIQVRMADDRVGERLLARGDVRIDPEKISAAEFDLLCHDIEQVSRGLLRDIYGMTRHADTSHTQLTPPAELSLVERLILKLDGLLGSLSTPPAPPGWLGMAAARSPRMPRPPLPPPARQGARRTEAQRRLVVAYMGYLEQQLESLSDVARAEQELRIHRRSYRDVRQGTGPTWWEQEDQPRLLLTEELIGRLRCLHGHLRRTRRRHAWLRHRHPLPAAKLSALLERHRREHGCFELMRQHVRATRVHIDATHRIRYLKNIPTLYEYWCTIKMQEVLLDLLEPETDTLLRPGSIFAMREQDDRPTFVLEMTRNSHMILRDRRRRIVRFRYQPFYAAPQRRLDRDDYGRLDPGRPYTPDMAIEVMPWPAVPGSAPEAIILLDCKYTSDPPRRKMDELRKYLDIGLHRTGRSLVRQIWLLSPGIPERPTLRNGPEWTRYIMTNNLAFFGHDFNPHSQVIGAVTMRPSLMGVPPLRPLLVKVLTSLGVLVDD